MPPSQDSVKVPEEHMNCMEVWGGSCTRNDCLQRPGIDIWIQSPSIELADAGGGDLHLLSSCASGRITRMLLADICGVGPLFSDIAGDLRDLMKRNLNSIQQQRMVRQISLRLDEASLKGAFASMLVSTFFAPTRSFTLCNTGHPPPLVFRKRDKSWSFLRQTSVGTSQADDLAGVVCPESYQHVKTKLAVGDMVFSYGEVLTECRGVDGLTLGLQGILDRVKKLGANNPTTFLTDLLQRLQDEHRDNTAVEGATVMLCQATDRKVAMRDNLLAPFRLLRSASDSTKID